jgi:acyl carrier protein
MVLIYVGACITEQIGREVEISEDTTLVSDLGLDSLDIWELRMKIEDQLSLEIPWEVFSACTSVNDIVTLILVLLP